MFAIDHRPKMVDWCTLVCWRFPPEIFFQSHFPRNGTFDGGFVIQISCRSCFTFQLNEFRAQDSPLAQTDSHTLSETCDWLAAKWNFRFEHLLRDKNHIESRLDRMKMNPLSVKENTLAHAHSSNGAQHNSAAKKINPEDPHNGRCRQRLKALNSPQWSHSDRLNGNYDFRWLNFFHTKITMKIFGKTETESISQYLNPLVGDSESTQEQSSIDRFQNR